MASDHIDVSAGMLPAELVKIMAAHGLAFDHSCHTGVVPHMFGALSHDFVGLTAIAQLRRGGGTLRLGNPAPRRSGTGSCRAPWSVTLFHPPQEAR